MTITLVLTCDKFLDYGKADWKLMTQKSSQFRDGTIVRSEDSLNLEMPFSTLDGFITPTEPYGFPLRAIVPGC